MREPLQKQNKEELFQVWLAYVSGSFLLSCFCFYLFYWSLDVVGCLLFVVDIKGPQGCLTESDSIYISVFFYFSGKYLMFWPITEFDPQRSCSYSFFYYTHILPTDLHEMELDLTVLSSIVLAMFFFTFTSLSLRCFLFHEFPLLLTLSHIFFSLYRLILF